VITVAAVTTKPWLDNIVARRCSETVRTVGVTIRGVEPHGSFEHSQRLLSLEPLCVSQVGVADVLCVCAHVLRWEITSDGTRGSTATPVA
jgi:hypothetical protein